MKTVLFVCVENSFRSVLSEEMFNHRAPAGWRAESGGVSPASETNPLVRELLAEIGISFGGHRPRLATTDLVSKASRVVSFGCIDRCPIGAKGKSEDWPVAGAKGKSEVEIHAIRDELSQRVDDLIARLGQF